MESSQSTQSKWRLTEEAFHRFLAALDSHPESAGEQYEAIRRKLVKFFDWRGAHFPEECADETINRVIRKIDAGEKIADIATYCLGVARLVFLETLKKVDRQQVSLENVQAIAVAPATNDEDQDERACFERCLEELPVESRQLILQYYQDELREKINNRQAMAERLGIPLNALRSRVQRIRDRLEQCVARCLGQ